MSVALSLRLRASAVNGGPILDRFSRSAHLAVREGDAAKRGDNRTGENEFLVAFRSDIISESRHKLFSN
jgi:hypothetical protein